MKAVTVSQASDFIRGITFKPHELIDPNEPDAIVCMRTKNIQRDLDQRDLIAVPSRLVRSEEKLLKPGDVLISSANSWELVGKCSYVAELPYRATAGGFIAIVRPKAHTHPRFLYHWLSSPFMQETLRNLGRQTTNISNLDVHRFKELDFPNLQYDRQRQIAAILDKADVIRRKHEQALTLVDQFLRSSFTEMFLSSEADWTKAKVSDVAELINGDRSSNYPSGSDIVNDGVLFVSTKNIIGSKLDLQTTSYITLEKFKSLTRGKLRRHDLVVTLRGSIGQAAIFDCEYETGFINAQLMIVRPGKRLKSSFLLHLFTHPKFQMQLLATQSGSAIPQLTAGQVGRMEIPVPPTSVQEQFDYVSKCSEKLLEKLRADFDHSNKLFGALSQRAFRGEL